MKYLLMTWHAGRSGSTTEILSSKFKVLGATRTPQGTIRVGRSTLFISWGTDGDVL